jgi:hypothetical protein
MKYVADHLPVGVTRNCLYVSKNCISKLKKFLEDGNPDLWYSYLSVTGLDFQGQLNDSFFYTYAVQFAANNLTHYSPIK